MNLQEKLTLIEEVLDVAEGSLTPAALFYCVISIWKVYRGSKLPAWAWCVPSSMCVCSVK